MKKTHKVVMLATEKASNLCLADTKLVLIKEAKYNLSNIKVQHLYIISDDEIKEGDWWYNASTGLIWKVTADNVKCYNQPSNMDRTGLNKIVATTDKSLGYTDHRISPVPNFCDYPQLPESFIQAYIKAYNEGKPITEVDLEMLISTSGSTAGELKDNEKLIIKTRPDNTVIVHQSKMYSKKEVEKLCEKAFRAGREVQNNLNGNKCPSAWIQDNLK